MRQNGKESRKRTISPRSGADVTAHQFAEGNPGGPGRPHTPKALIQEMYAEGDATALRQILEAQKRRALKGDTQAARFLIETGWGKPTQPLAGDPDAPPIKMIHSRGIFANTHD